MDGLTQVLALGEERLPIPDTSWDHNTKGDAEMAVAVQAIGVRVAGKPQQPGGCCAEAVCCTRLRAPRKQAQKA